MPTRTYSSLATVDTANFSSRVPLEALQMLTQSVAKCTQDYIQPLPLKDEEQKKSPLALLAATCSSIGKTEPTKTAEPEKDKTGALPPKISADESRSSFKPYKQAADKTEDMSTGEKPGFRSPSSKENPPRSPVETKDERKHPSMYQYPETDSHCAQYLHSPQSRICGVFLEPGQAPGLHSAMHKDCSSGGGCPHPASLVPFRGTSPSYPSLTSEQAAAMKSHGLPSSLGPAYQQQCACMFCTPHGEAQAMAGVPRGLPMPHGPATPYTDYLQRTVCREPNCTNCKPLPSPYGMPPGAAAMQQCGPHCVQCDSMKAVEQSQNTPFSCFYPHSLAMFKGAQDDAHPFVCNWVSGAKHCGKSFATSEDLFQHLRSHTQLGNSVGSPVPQASPACNVHGCPCKLRASPVQSTSPRYRPYYYKPTVLPTPPPTGPMVGCYSPYAPMHSLPYDPHRLFK